MNVTNDVIMPIVLMLLGTIVPFLLNLLYQWTVSIKEKRFNDKVDRYITQAEKSFSNAVLQVEQTFVKKMKEAGTWDEAAMRKAFKEAMNIGLSQLSKDAIATLEQAWGDFKAWATAKIESEVGKESE